MLILLPRLLSGQALHSALDSALILQLDSIFENDQKHRREVMQIINQFGWGSKEAEAKWKEIKPIDSLNLLIVTQLIDTKGWLGSEIIGGKGNHTLFLVIQHADLQTQEKYLPVMKEAVTKGNANAKSMALLEDRVALGQGKKQIYGTQIGTDAETGENYILPLEDPLHVDERRIQVGLTPMIEYVKRWGINWDPETYNKSIPNIESKYKKSNQ
jgi:hypothetical protein